METVVIAESDTRRASTDQPFKPTKHREARASLPLKEKTLVGDAHVRSPIQRALYPLPCVTVDTRALIVNKLIDRGADAFTLEAIDELEASNPELLRMAHNFASAEDDYLTVMQAFGILYETLRAQSIADRACLH